MKNYLTFLIATIILIAPLHQIHAKEDKELRKQRQEAKKERRAEKKERNQDLADATKSFREFTRDLKTEYASLLKDIDTEFEFTQIDLQAARQAKVSEAEIEYRKKWTGLLMNAGSSFNAETLKKMEEEAKAYSDELFRLKEEAAKIAHKEKMAVEKKKHDLLQKRDTRALEEASSLGLTTKVTPILAKPIGGELTRQEKQWNEREKKEIEKIFTRNHKTIQEYQNGKTLRKWEQQNLNEDFQLKWEEKRELHALESQLTFFNSILMLAAQGEKGDRQEILDKFADLRKQTQFVKIKYNTAKKKNSLRRRIEKKKIQEGAPLK